MLKFLIKFLQFLTELNNALGSSIQWEFLDVQPMRPRRWRKWRSRQIVRIMALITYTPQKSQTEGKITVTAVPQ